MNLHFDQPALLLLALVAVPLAVIGWRATVGIDAARRVIAIGLRTVLVAAIAVMLAGPHLAREHDQLTVIGLLDMSGSVQRFAQIPPIPDRPAERRTYVEALRTWFREATETKAPDDRFGLVVFDGQAIAAAAPSRDGSIDDLEITGTAGTSIAEAIRLGLAMFPADTAKRLVLVTDGNETIGDAIDAARQAAGRAAAGAGTRSVPIDILPIAYRVRRDAQVVRIETPANAQPGQTVTVRVHLEASAPTAGRLTLRREDETIDLNGDDPGRSRPVTLDAGRTVHLVEVPLLDTPVNRFEAIFEPDEPGDDALPDNNRAEAFIATPGKGRILVVGERARADDDRLTAILLAADLPAVSIAPAALPADLLSLQNYDLVVLDNVPAYALQSEQHELLSRYVNDLGGGLIMIGGERSFGAGGWNGTALEDVLPLELDPPKELRLPQAALVLVLDQSGSMNRPVAGARASQQQVANEAAAIAIESLRAESLVAIVTFHSFATEYVPLQRNDDPRAIARRIRGITAGGGTDLEPALRKAYEILRDVDADRKHVVCLTDGQSPDADLESIVERMVAANIKLTTIAVGDEADHERLNHLAVLGQGEFYPVYNAKALPRVLVDSVKSINKPLVKESPFVPVVRPTGTTLTQGLDRAPPLGGLVVTAPRDDPRATIDMTHPDGEPLLARWQAGLGRVAAFTSDVGGRWSRDWESWAPGDAFWTQLARATARPAVSHEAELLAEIRDGRLYLTLEAADANGAFIDYLLVEGSVYPPEGDPIAVRLPQSAPGRYETSVPARAAGNYIVALNPARGARQLAPVIGGASQTTGDEFRRYDSNLALLDRLLEVTGGRRLSLDAPREADLFDRAGMPASISLLPAWRTMLWVALALLLLDIASRRIAWSGSALRRLAARAVARVTPAHVRGRQATATLSSLRRVSDRFEEQVRSGARGVDHLEAPAPVEPPTRFEPAPEPPEPSRVKAALSALLGRPAPDAPDAELPTPASDDPAPPDPAPGRPDDEPEGDTGTTSSLLRAKRRARERLDR